MDQYQLSYATHRILEPANIAELLKSDMFSAFDGRILVTGFSDLLNKMKPGKGDDLVNFTVEELQECIDEYTSAGPPPPKPKPQLIDT